MSFFHSFEADANPQDLLDPANHYSTPWGEPDHGPCDKCEGNHGECTYECLSCLERGADPDCPACGGRVSFTDVCPACEGDGTIDRTRRRGISVFPTLEGLRRYLTEEEGEFDGRVIVELEGRLSDERDLDADQGALLAFPERIVAVHPARPKES